MFAKIAPVLIWGSTGLIVLALGWAAFTQYDNEAWRLVLASFVLGMLAMYGLNGRRP